MDFRYVMSFAASPDQVFELFRDPEFVDKRAALGAKEHEATTEPTDIGGVVIHVRRTIPVKVPGFAQKFVGDAVKLHHTETWGPADSEGERLARYEGKITGSPGVVNGTIKLTKTETGSELLIRGTVTVPIPLVGSKLAKLGADSITRGFKYEERFTQEWLAAQASA